MSRCKACDRIMRRVDWDTHGEGPEEELCSFCRQEIFIQTDSEIVIGFDLDEVIEMGEGYFNDYSGNDGGKE